MNFTIIGIMIAKLFLMTGTPCTASWYGEPFNGELTASGIVYDMFELTCAHPTLPLGTIVLFWNEETGVWLICRVTDRGPFRVNSDGYAIFPLEPHPTRQFDLSVAAFNRLSQGRLIDGVMDLRYRIIGRDTQDMIYNIGQPDEAACERERLEW